MGHVDNSLRHHGLIATSPSWRRHFRRTPAVPRAHRRSIAPAPLFDAWFALWQAFCRFWFHGAR